MSEQRITKAVVLAAGTGSRLGSAELGVPKPCRPVAGVPLLVRVLRTLRGAGIRQVVVVTGYEGGLVRQRLLEEPSLGLELHFTSNPRLDSKNGTSLLTAREWLDGECILSMADHVYSGEIVRRLMAMALPAGACALGVDYDIERCFDLDDATKVRVSAGRIVDIGKELPSYEALDTGVFRIGPAFFEELASIHAERGDVSLSEAGQRLAARGAFLACDVEESRWIDVDTPEALERAEAMLRVFGDSLGDEPGSSGAGSSDPHAVELFAPTWVRAARAYDEAHFAVAAADASVLRMMSNESPFGPSSRVLRAIVEAATTANLYPRAGLTLRERLASREGLRAENVMLGAGSTELIDVAIRAFVAPGEEVVASVPTFSMYEARTRVAGGIPVLVPLTDEYTLDVGAVIRAVSERTKLIFLCSPNNPTGGSLGDGDLRRIARLGLPVAVDEAYGELGDGTSASGLCFEHPNVLVLRTFSKAYGLAGLRLGYGLGHEALIQTLSKVKLPWTVSDISVAAALAMLDDAEETGRRIQELRAGRVALERALAALPGLSVLSSGGNFVTVDVSGTGAAAAVVVQRLLAEGILVRSLEAHHATRGCVRITVGSAEQNARCVAAMARVLGRAAGAASTTGLVGRPAAPETLRRQGAE